ncbi:MAG: hypothetical protein IKM08_02545, partial [Clostridia bacterium]|nr:hypothetical protein [Clostridia bacterium]
SPSDIAAVAVDSATHTWLACDKNFDPLRPAIHWTDSRSRPEAEELLASHGDEILQKSFHKPDTIWTLPQLLWLRRNEPQIFARIRYIFFEKDYIRYFLTGAIAPTVLRRRAVCSLIAAACSGMRRFARSAVSGPICSRPFVPLLMWWGR